MINPLLHRKPVPVDRTEHRAVQLTLPVQDWSIAAELNSVFIAASEFADVAREFPILFVQAGTDEAGKPEIAPIAVFGLVQKQNLFVEQGRWRATAMPTTLRVYPFCVGRVDAERWAVCLDAAWSGVVSEGGHALFGADGEPTDILKDVGRQLEAFEAVTQQTRILFRRLRDLELLRPMRFDAKLPDGSTLGVDGFLTVDEQKLQALDAATVYELFKSGLLGLVHAHMVSLGHVRKLLDWHIARLPAAPAAPAA